jgi:hypothetical protein
LSCFSITLADADATLQPTAATAQRLVIVISFFIALSSKTDP